jgi:hypothetical protein
MEHDNDQDIDTAGTEADQTYHERHGGERIEAPDVTEGPLGVAPGSQEPQRGSDHRTLHRAEDDDAAYARSPEYHDQPGSGRERGGPSVSAGDADE